MTIKSAVKTVLAALSPAHVAALNASGHKLEADAISIVDQVLHALKTAVVGTANAASGTTVGEMILQDIRAIEQHNITAQQKFEIVVQNTVPVLAVLGASGGAGLVKGDLDTLARALVQNVFAAEFSTTAGKTAQLLAPILHIELPKPAGA
jgi:hypothetical protein